MKQFSGGPRFGHGGCGPHLLQAASVGADTAHVPSYLVAAVIIVALATEIGPTRRMIRSARYDPRTLIVPLVAVLTWISVGLLRPSWPWYDARYVAICVAAIAAVVELKVSRRNRR